jgi:methyl-accepting chemotaxis protein
MRKWVTTIPISRRLMLVLTSIALISIGAILTVSLLTVHFVRTSSPSGQASTLSSTILISNSIVLLLLLAVLFIAGFVVNQTIIKPLTDLVEVTRRIKNGEAAMRAQVYGRDEISVVADSINHMLDVIVGQHTHLQQRVTRLVNEVSGIAKGDLRIHAEVTPDSLGMLADFFNSMAEALGLMIMRVKEMADDVQNTAASTQERMRGQVQTADQHLYKIEVATHEVQKMSQASSQVAQSASRLGEKAKEARQSTLIGRERVQEIVRGMGDLHDITLQMAQQVHHLDQRSKQIHEIVELISQTARQTERLALDASIQAVMAGGTDHGFGPIATDIRRLSEVAQQQVLTITQIVRSVREDIGVVATSMKEVEQETERGTNYVRETGGHLQSIFDLIEQQATDVQVINDMVRTQLNSSSAVVHTMQEVSQSTTQSSQQIHGVALNMDLLTKKAERLRASVSAFQVKEQPKPRSSQTTSLLS